MAADKAEMACVGFLVGTIVGTTLGNNIVFEKRLGRKSDLRSPYSVGERLMVGVTSAAVGIFAGAIILVFG